MPSDGSGTYTLPTYLAVAGQAILASLHNTPLEDIEAALTARVMASGAKAMTGHLSLVNSSPSNALHAASKGYVDAQIAAIAQKSPVVCRTTANITLSGEQTLDGVLTSGSRVLVMAQTSASENGIYVSAAGAWSRSTDADSWAELVGALVIVSQGTLYADTIWICTNDTGGTLGSTSVAFKRVDIHQIVPNAQTGTTYTVLASDKGKYVSQSNGSAIAVTVPQATTAFGSGFWFISRNLGAGAATYTPTTSTVNGASTLIERTGDAHLWVSDGTNWFAASLGPTYEWITGLTEDTTGDVNDFWWTGDVSATLNKKLKFSTYQTLMAASAAQQETGSSNAVNVTPGVQHRHQSALKFWGSFDFAGGTNASYNVTSITDTGTGRITVTIGTDFSSGTWCCTLGLGLAAGGGLCVAFGSKAAGSIELRSSNGNTASLQDGDGIDVMGAGDQ